MYKYSFIIGSDALSYIIIYTCTYTPTSIHKSCYTIHSTRIVLKNSVCVCEVLKRKNNRKPIDQVCREKNDEYLAPAAVINKNTRFYCDYYYYDYECVRAQCTGAAGQTSAERDGNRK